MGRVVSDDELMNMLNKQQKMPFTIGDIVVGNKQANGKYGVTKEGVQVKVIDKQLDNRGFKGLVMSGDHEGYEFSYLEPAYFDHIE